MLSTGALRAALSLLAPAPAALRLEIWCRRCPDRPPLVIPAAPRDISSSMSPSAPLLPAPLGGPCSCHYLGVRAAPNELYRMTATARAALTRSAAAATAFFRTEHRCAHVDQRGRVETRGRGRCGPGHLQLHLHTEYTTSARGGTHRRVRMHSRRAASWSLPSLRTHTISC